MFASALDLLSRANESVLAQLAVPTDTPMPENGVLRAVIESTDLANYTAEDVSNAQLALNKINIAIADAHSLIESYGIASNAISAMLKRSCTTIALYYLRGENVTKELQSQYDATIDLLDRHSKGFINLTPIDPNAPDVVSDEMSISSGPARYVPASGASSDDW